MQPGLLVDAAGNRDSRWVARTRCCPARLEEVRAFRAKEPGRDIATPGTEQKRG